MDTNKLIEQLMDTAKLAYGEAKEIVFQLLDIFGRHVFWESLSAICVWSFILIISLVLYKKSYLFAVKIEKEHDPISGCVVVIGGVFVSLFWLLGLTVIANNIPDLIVPEKEALSELTRFFKGK